MINRRTFLATSAVALGAGAQGALAETAPWPSRTIKLVVPFSPGGGGDVLGRLLGDKLSAALKETVVVENKPGGSTVVATDMVVRSPADGYTILLNVPLIVQTVALMSKLPYDPIRDLLPVTDVCTSSLWLAVNPQRVKARTLKEFVAEVKAHPKTHSYGSIGMGSTTHLFGHQLNASAMLDLVHVPYKGSSPAVMAAVAGEVSAVILDDVTLKKQVEAGRLRLIAVTGAQRSPLTPDVPTFTEQGYPGFEIPVWAGLFLPSKTPAAIVDKLYTEVTTIIKQPDVIARFAELGYTPGGMPPAKFAQQVREEKDRWGELIHKAGVKLD